MLNLVATMTVALALGQADGVSLKWKLTEGETFYARSENKMTQTITAMGMDIEQKQDQTLVYRYKVLQATADGYTIEQTLLQSITDANFGAQVPGLGALDAKMKGAKFTFKLDKNLKATKVEGMDEFVKKFDDEDELTKGLLKSMINEELLKKSVEETFRYGPEQAVRKGDTWEREEKLPLGPLGDIQLKSKYTYAGPKGDLEAIDYTAAAEFSSPKEDAAIGPVKIKKVDLKSDKITGSILFDAKAGRIKQSTQEMSLGGTMTAGIGELEVEMQMKQKLSSKVEILDKNPVVD